ncbi:hypothetical protein BH10PLA1_BH10PLA1_06640 [soil metagenome]
MTSIQRTFRAAVLLAACTAFTPWSRAQNVPTSGPAEGAEIPRTIPPQPKPSSDPMMAHDPLDFALDPWNHTKSTMNEQWGLKFQGSYTFHNQYATETISSRHDEFGGRLDLGANWTVFTQGKDVGQIIGLVRSSENIGISQKFAVSDEVGSIDGTNSLHGGGEQIPISVNLIYYRQTFMDQKLAFSIGKIHPNSWIDLSPIANDETQQFMAGAYTGNESNPGQGLWSPGVAGEFNITDQIYLHGVVANSLGRTATAGLNNLDEGAFYEALELGYKCGQEGEPQGNYRVTLWHNDHNVNDGYGGSVGFDQEIGGGWAPFARLGHGEKDATAIRDFVSLGIANLRPFERRGDMFGIAGTYSHPSDNSLREELLFETFYRVKLTESLEFSPDLQWIVHPAFQPDADNVFVIGARLKFLF